jgi:hypothetical protein
MDPALPVAGSTGGRTLYTGATLLNRVRSTGGRTLNTGAAPLATICPLITDAVSIWTRLVLLTQNKQFYKGKTTTNSVASFT